MIFTPKVFTFKVNPMKILKVPVEAKSFEAGHLLRWKLGQYLGIQECVYSKFLHRVVIEKLFDAFSR